MLAHVDRDNHLVAPQVARANAPVVRAGAYSVVCVLPLKETETDKERIHRKDQWEIDPAGGSYAPGYSESNLHQVSLLGTNFSGCSGSQEDGISEILFAYHKQSGRCWRADCAR